ncbi:MAG: SUMF1/EgtB/PvdO family nonheme iron enzyme [Desulfobulbaceae bacterium]|uniref:SUMF1/EgtB/PvdO family nonheme iron enzyme n=1 Tax=Candidatus Desulfobia pelagia TaxID=2841692 RepID=A0A8J6NEQ9_9BACT|nr:SUMF1/EgtB/PvdO family nonheme iron enzyme [Candidatus Desulfobia pelagia]
MSFVTLQGIHTAVSNLALRQGTLQEHLLSLLLSYFSTETSLEEISVISPDELVKDLWGVDSEKEIRNKKKNLSSLKSAVNKRFKGLSELENPEGLIIGKDNVFTVSEEHKNNLLNKLGITSGSGDPAMDLFASMRGILDGIADGGDAGKLQAMLSELDKTREIIDQLIQEKGEGAGRSGEEGGSEGSHDIEEIELEEGEEIIVVGGQESEGTGTGSETGYSDGGAELIESDGFQSQEIYEDLAEDEELVEEIIDDEIEPEIIEEEDLLDDEDQDEELIEVSEEDDLAGTEEDESPEGLGDGDGSGSASDTGIKPGSDHETTGHGEDADLSGQGQDTGTSPKAGCPSETGPETTLGSVEETDTSGENDDLQLQSRDGQSGLLDEVDSDSAQQDIEILADEELVEEILDDELETEIIEEGEIIDDEELIEDEEDFPEIKDPESSEDSAITDKSGSAEGAGKQPGSIGGKIDQNGDLTGLGQDTETGHPDKSGYGSEQQDVEILEDEELVEEILDDELEPEIIEEEEIVDEEELIEDEELVEEIPDDELEPEIVEEEEILDEETLIEDEDLLEVAEVDIAEDDEVGLGEQNDAMTEGTPSSQEKSRGGGKGDPSLSGTEQGAGAEKAEESSGQPLDLSRYIEPSDALENLPDTLNESNDELIRMIMQRFMPPFIQIPSGSYPVGSKHPRSMDRPEHSVILNNFHISQIPVTNDIFDFFIRETGYETDAEKKGYGTVVEGRFSRKTNPDTGKETLVINPGVRFQRVEGATWRHPKGPYSSLENKASHPVVQVSRRDAIAFASWAGKKLPSEDEWEAAARGKAGLLFPWGDDWLDTYGNFESSQIGDTTPVTHYGKKAMSPFGLLDMLGNILEWTSSRPLDVSSEGNAPRLSILKGGSWATGGLITSATRFLERDNTWSNIIGFRCAV